MPVDYSVFSLVLIAMVLAVAFVFGTMFLIRAWMSWKQPSPEKSATYECGEDTMGSAWLRFNIRFYLFALAFLLFEVELVVTLPVILIMRGAIEMPQGTTHVAAFVLVELFLFLAVLFAGLVYVWASGDLDWVRAAGAGGKPVKRDLMPARSADVRAS